MGKAKQTTLALIESFLKKRRNPLLILAVLGPGLIATAAGNDAGGIATYAVAGADYGTAFLWLLIPLTIGMYIVQEMSARLGAATGKGFSDLVRENFDLRATIFMMGLLFIANAGVVVSNFAGMAASLELFGISKFASIPVLTMFTWLLTTKGTYRKVEKIFILMSTALLSYVFAAFFATPQWSQVGRDLIIPHISTDASYLGLLVAFIGTTIAPYMQMYLQNAVVERGVTIADMKVERLDTLIGCIFGNLVTLFIIIATASTLFPSGIHIESAADAALALVPFAGNFAKYLFGFGLFGASMLAANVIALTTCFAICNAFGWESGVNKTVDEAPMFYSIFALLIVMAATITLAPAISLIKLLLNLQILNGILLPFELFFMLRLINNKELMGRHTNGRIFNVFAWGTTISVSLAAIVYVVMVVFPFVQKLLV